MISKWPWAFSLALLVAGCGARSGLDDREAIETAGDAGTSPNRRCVGIGSGEVVTLLSAEMQPAHLGVSGETLIVAEWPFTGNVFRMPRTGGAVTSVLADDEPAVNDLVADARGAAWVVNGFGGTGGAVRGASTRASRATTLVGSLTRPRGLALFDDVLYFSDGIGPPDDAVNGRIQRLERGARHALVLASGLGDPWAVAADASGVYFTDTGKVFSLPHEGGVPTVLAETGGLIEQLATNGRELFWADASGSLHRRDHATGKVLLVGTIPGLIEGIAADAGGAYLAQRSGASDVATGGVFEIREDGLTLLAPTSDGPLGIAIDASAIYFASVHGVLGSISMLCRENVNRSQ